MLDRRLRAGGSSLAAMAAVAIGIVAAPAVAHAQFFWDQPRLTADDAARSAMAHGYRVLSRPQRNQDVFVAEVIDRRGERERLIIAADSGQILQRFYSDADRGYRRYTDPSIPPGPLPPARIPNEDHEPGLLSKLFGNDDAPVATAPLPVPSERLPPLPDRPIRAPHLRRPRVVEQNPDTVREPPPVESAPLAPPSAAPVIQPRVVRPAPVPAQAALPPPAATPPTAPPRAPTAIPTGPVKSISSNPLAIPGSREQDEKANHKPAEATAASAKAAAAPAKPPAPKLPTPAATAKAPVAVAPLE